MVLNGLTLELGDVGRSLPQPWPVVVGAYLTETHLRGGSRRTPVEYRRILERFFNTFPDPNVVTPLAVHSFAYARNPGTSLPAPSTIAVRLAAISGLYEFARRLGAIGANPAAEVRRPRRRRPLAKELTTDQVQRLLAAIPETGSGLRDRSIIILILLEGLRRSEVLSLRVADVDFATGDYRVRVKGGHERRRQIPPPALHAIVRALEAQGRALDRLEREAPLFTITGSGLYANLRRYATAAGLDNVSPHVLRHAAAKLRRRSGASIEDVSSFLGHSSIATTAIYLRRQEVEPDEGWRNAARALGLVAVDHARLTGSGASRDALGSVRDG